MSHLKQTTPEEAVDRYLKDKRTYVSSKTYYNYKTALKRLKEWFQREGYDDMRDVDSEVIDRFKEYRLESVKPITARNDLRTIRNFVEFCESIKAVPVGTHELIRIPKVKEEDEISDVALTKEEADAILEYLGKYEYADQRHVIMMVLWKTGMRKGGLRALDVEDFDAERPALEVRHRPETETPLKRKEKSQRDVLLTKDQGEIIEDYLENNRPDATDKFGREPLVASRQGRMNRTTITRHVYIATRPCFYNGGNCPFDRDLDECEATYTKHAFKCPGSVSPHALRRGYVTAARNAGQPKDVTGARVNMSGKILDKHYDKGTHDEKAERRRGFLQDV